MTLFSNFGVDLRRELADGMGESLDPMVLVRVTPGARTVGDPTAATPDVEVQYPCRGLISDYEDNQINGTSVKKGDRIVQILGGTLPDGIRPAVHDEVIAADPVTGELARYHIERTGADPVQAMWSLQGRAKAV